MGRRKIYNTDEERRKANVKYQRDLRLRRKYGIPKNVPLGVSKKLVDSIDSASKAVAAFPHRSRYNAMTYAGREYPLEPEKNVVIIQKENATSMTTQEVTPFGQ